jgi:hypothetical protein
MKTSTISLRVPLDFKAQIIKICENYDITISDYAISRLVPNGQTPPVNANALQKIKQGGTIVDNGIPTELSNMLGVTGGLFIGVIVYRALKDALKDNNEDWTDEKIQAIAFASGVASGLISGIGIQQISEDFGL